jgi:N6-L-threonylcarbamoyladenine synthase
VYLLAIESSCDDTAVAVLEDGNPLSNIVSSQTLHRKYGGVVPEMASREHQKNIGTVAGMALEKAGIPVSALGAVAFTRGPGLPGSLMVGASFAKGLALSLGVPLISVNHMEAHVLSLLIPEERPSFPFLALVVSGGHTLLVRVKDWNRMEILGSTRDDAVGEAFDKCAKLLGLGYPGGKQIDELARTGNPHRFSFPVARADGYDFSYSGVKTAFLYFLQSMAKDDIQASMADLAASVQRALLAPLLTNTRKAWMDENLSMVGVAGGVAANSALRQELSELASADGRQIYFPRFEYCTDNAAMIGKAAWFRYREGLFGNMGEETDPRLAIGQG